MRSHSRRPRSVEGARATILEFAERILEPADSPIRLAHLRLAGPDDVRIRSGRPERLESFEYLAFFRDSGVERRDLPVQVLRGL